MIDLYDYSLVTIFLVGLCMILATSEIARRLGALHSARGGRNIAALEGAVVGMLALILGFTFAMALSLFEARRDAVLNEANAIGTTALRARLLPEPHRAEALRLLNEYVKVRLALTQHTPTQAELTTAIEQSNNLQEALWQQATTLAANDQGLVPTGLFIQTLNEMIDNQGKRLAAVRNRIPNIVLLGLFGIAAVAGAFVGYGSGLEAQRSRLPVYVMAILIAAVILLILDLDRPGAGFIYASQQPMVDAAASIAAFAN